MMNADRLSLVALLSVVYLASDSVAIALASPTVSTDGLYCSDRYGYRVPDGVEYMPEDDPCKKCQCQSGFAVMCRSVLCSAPTCSMYESLKNECCVFHCIQPSLDVPKNNGNGSIQIYKDVNSVNLSIRLVASAVTSLLIFALLIFMIHRLRQRRLLISMRRLNNDRRSVNDGLDYMTNIDQLDIGFEFPPYEDPPPPYSPPKPFDDIPTEAPPPYELTSSHMETEPMEITHAVEVRSNVGEDTDEQHPVAESAAAAAAAVMLLGGNTGWTNSHSIRPLSALEPFQSELIELSQPNLDSKSAMTLSSPVLIGQKRNAIDCRCHSPRFTNDSRSGEQFNVIQRSTDSDMRAPSQMPDNHSVSTDSAQKHLSFRQMKFETQTPKLLLKMHKLAHSSLLRHNIEATAPSRNISSTSDQHLFLEKDFCKASSSERSSKDLNDLETVNVESDIDDDDQNETRVKHVSPSNWDSIRAECCSSLMQRSAPEVSLFLKSSQVSCADPKEEKKPLNVIKVKDKSKPLLRKQKQTYPSRPQSCSGPDVTPNTKRSSFLAHNLTSEHCNTALKKKMAEHPSSCLFVHLVHDDDSSSCVHDSNDSIKKQPFTSEGATTVDDSNPLQASAGQDQSDFNVATTLDLADKQSILESALMAVCSKSNQSSVGLPLLSPDLPVYRQFLRSESITSQASFYSICSETGEKKHTKSVLPKESKDLSAMSTGSGYLSPSDVSKNTGLKEHAEIKDLSGAGVEITGKDMTSSTSLAASSLPVQVSQNYPLSYWKVKKNHSATNRNDPSANKIKNEKRSVGNSNNLQVTLMDAVAFPSSKCLKALPHDRILGCDHLTGTKMSKAQSFDQNIAESNGKVSRTNTELYSNAGEAEPSHESCKVTVKSAHDDKGRLIFKDQLRQGVKEFVPGHKKHSYKRSKDHLNNGKKHKSKHIESFEYLVSRILQQLETSHFDEVADRHNAGQKVQRSRRFGRKSDCYSTEVGLSSKSVARPISLPNAKHSYFIEGSVNAEMASLDFANRNSCMLEPVGNDNDGSCQHLQHDAESHTDGCHSSGSAVSVAL